MATIDERFAAVEAPDSRTEAFPYWGRIGAGTMYKPPDQVAGWEAPQQPVQPSPTPAPQQSPAPIPQPPTVLDEALRLRRQQMEDAQRTSDRMKERSDLATRMAFQPTPRPPLPQFQDIPQAEKFRARSALTEFKPAAVFAALMFSGLAKGKMVNALQAGTGFLEGFQEGDKLKIEQKRQQWKDSVEAAVKQNEVEMKRYNAIVVDTKLSQVDRQARIAALAAANKDDVLRNTVVSGGVEGVAQLLEARVKAQEELRKSIFTATAKRGGTVDDQDISGAKRKTPEELEKEVEVELSSQGKTSKDPDYAELKRRSLELKVKEQETKAAKPDLGFYKGTEAQLKGVFFASMMERGNRNLQKLKSEGYQPSWKDLTVMDQIWATSKTNPRVSNQLFAALTEPAQKYFQASAEFVAGVLRKETGAAFNAGELINELQRYIIGPWDTPGMATQKEEARRGVEDATWASTGLPTSAWNLESAKRLLGGSKGADTALGEAPPARDASAPVRPTGVPANATFDSRERKWWWQDPKSPTGWMFEKAK